MSQNNLVVNTMYITYSFPYLIYEPGLNRDNNKF